MPDYKSKIPVLEDGVAFPETENNLMDANVYPIPGMILGPVELLQERVAKLERIVLGLMQGACQHSMQDKYIENGVLHCHECEEHFLKSP